MWEFILVHEIILSLWDYSHDLLRANDIQKYIWIHHPLHLGMSQFISCVVLMKWSQDKDARERSREGEFSHGWCFGYTTSLERRYRISTRGYKLTLDWRVYSKLRQWFTKNKFYNFTFCSLIMYSFSFSLSLCICINLDIYIYYWGKSMNICIFTIFIFSMITIYKNLSR